MATNFVCNQLQLNKDKLIVKTASHIKLAHVIRATGQMLVDSEELAFLYILDCEDGYNYVVFNRETWPALKENMDQKLPVFVLVDDEEIELTDFHSELTFLISNIKDNPNYGEKMNEEVKRIFF